MMTHLPWIILSAYVVLLLALDFLVLHRKHAPVSSRRAMRESIFFIGNALLFTVVVYWLYAESMVDNINNLTPRQSVVKYITGYLIELSLSVDNLFVIAMIFEGYRIPRQYQHRLLFLGIIGAIVFRAILIALGLALVHAFHNVTIVFGLFLLYTAFRMLRKEAEHAPPRQPRVIFGFIRMSNVIDGAKFRTKVDGKTVFTALFGALLTIEMADLLFAVDSIPAILAVTTDPFLVLSSNVFAIMGLRSLYFFLAGMLEKFAFLKYSVFAILIFVSLKLITANWVDIPEWFSLSFITCSLAMGVWISILRLKADARAADTEADPSGP
ncbi:MAG: TerC/Alx family metal homeostasis membrane protein [Saprospiraceae bacterium]|nr:TerC/Alx family metal homeostasis membrane protein [Saprospiraceae bacterium]